MPREPSNSASPAPASSRGQALSAAFADHCRARKRKRIDEQQVRWGQAIETAVMPA